MAENLMVKVASNLRAISTLHKNLLTEAVHSANDPLMPGGKAMVELAPVARPQQYIWQIDYIERVLEQHPDLSADDDDWEPPLQTLLYWSEKWRIVHDMELTDRRPTIATEVNFLRWCLEWAWDHEPRFEKFASDIATAKRRLEDTLKSGSRPERTRVVCDRDYCENPSQLIRVYAPREHVADECVDCGGLYDPDSSDDCRDCGTMLQPVYNSDPADDRWKCPSCKHIFNDDDYGRAHGKQLRADGAQRFVYLHDAIGTLQAQGRSEHTIRKWLRDSKVNGYCDLTTHKVYVWWPDLWVLHLSTKTRKRVAA